MKTTFDCSAAEPQTSNKLNRCKTLVLVSVQLGKTLYFPKIVRNDDVTPFKKSEKKQHESELWFILALFGRFGLFKRISRKSIPSGIIHAKETSISTQRKVVKDN